ncbi:hypothetical protein H0H81_008615 [Sphagnurus paluster]|uniref:Autophagy-related protein 101 n=1 Tax=Sphagnurus paluster TaxID=117069 RepID=A0A9P7FSJ0_9AGAR|nr:hypothetical protein H0H81_008615 [Sphagnurus paluster]
MATGNVSHPTITIDLVLDRLTTKDVLKGILHSILFHRLFGTVKPTSFEVLDVTMPGVSDPEMEQLVNDKVDAFWKGIEGGANKRGQRSDPKSHGFRCIWVKKMFHGNNGA